MRGNNLAVRPVSRHWNERGLTLVELLAALVLTGVVLTSTLFLFNQLHSGVSTITSREQIMKESRQAINHIVAAARMETATASSDAAHVLILQYASGDKTVYTFDETKQQLSYTRTTNGHQLSGLLASHVSSISVKHDPSGQHVTVSLVMALPNKQTYETATVVNIPSL